MKRDYHQVVTLDREDQRNWERYGNILPLRLLERKEKWKVMSGMR
jgi:hypothetical protein